MRYSLCNSGMVHAAARVLAAAAIAATCIFSGSASAGDGFSGKDLPVLMEIPTVPAFSAAEVDLDHLVRLRYDITGTVDRIHPDLVIDDSALRIFGAVSLSGIRPGDHVGVRMNSNREVIEVERLAGPRNRPESGYSDPDQKRRP